MSDGTPEVTVWQALLILGVAVVGFLTPIMLGDSLFPALGVGMQMLAGLLGGTALGLLVKAVMRARRGE